MNTAGKCAKCGLMHGCCRQPEGLSPAFCSTKFYGDALEQAWEEYADAETLRFAQAASIQEQACYELDRDRPELSIPRKPRILEIVEFCGRMGYHKLGLAFCGGLQREAAVVCDILEKAGFQVVSAICKVGCMDKSQLGLKDAEKINGGGHESACNPIGQAYILNEAETEFNIVLGLCVGHDSLFFKHSQALGTVFAVKDRVLGHNPLAAIYTSPSYYKYLPSQAAQAGEKRKR